jgi:hypothetical protein
MPTTPYLPQPPTQMGTNLSPTDYSWQLIVQGLAPLFEVDTSKGSYSETVPAAGVNPANPATGQSAQGKEIIYVKTSADSNTYTLNGVQGGPLILKKFLDVIRIKSDGTNWWSSMQSSGGSSSISGANLAPALPIAGLTYGGSSGLAGYTVILRLPAPFVLAATNGGVKVGIVTTPGSTALVVHSASIGATLPGGTAWTTPPVPFTWPAGSFVNPETIYLSNSCAIDIDEEHDYYITVYFDPSSSANGYNYANTATGNPFAFWQGLSGYLSGNHTNDADASALQSPSGNGLFCIGQVVAA